MHTPGPWTLLHGNTIFEGDNTTLAIAVVTKQEKNAAANARLIVAAPDLLAALESARDLLASVDCLSPNNIRNLAGYEVDKIDAAIAKARGTP